MKLSSQTLAWVALLALPGCPATEAQVSLDAGEPALSCTPTATPTQPQGGQSVTLAAGCANAAAGASFLWALAPLSDPGCPQVPAAAATGLGQPSLALTAAASTPAGCSYALTVSDGARSGAFAVGVSWSAVSLFACSFSALSGAATVSFPLAVAVTCHDPASPLSVSWSTTAPAGVAQFAAASPTADGLNSITFQSAGAFTITAEVSSGADSATAQAQVVVSPTNATNLCAAQGFSRTLFYRWNWNDPAAPSHLDTVTMAAMGGGVGLGIDGILVVEFTPTLPANPGAGSFPYMSQIAVTPYPANSVTRPTLALSSTPCELNAPPPGTATSSSVSLPYGVGPVPISAISGRPSAVSLTPGVPVYINVAGRDQISDATPFGVSSCTPDATQSCEVRLTPFKPPGH